jgi:hypothetical protein
MWKGVLTLSLAKLRPNDEAVLENYVLFICGDLQHITKLLCKKCAKISLKFSYFFLYLYLYIATGWTVRGSIPLGS